MENCTFILIYMVIVLSVAALYSETLSRMQLCKPSKFFYPNWYHLTQSISTYENAISKMKIITRRTRKVIRVKEVAELQYSERPTNCHTVLLLKVTIVQASE